MISAFQNCSKFEDWNTFGKTHYPKENINMLSHSVSDKVPASYFNTDIFTAESSLFSKAKMSQTSSQIRDL